MPSEGTKRRAVRVDDGLWLPARARAKERGEDLSTILRNVLSIYVQEPDVLRDFIDGHAQTGKRGND